MHKTGQSIDDPSGALPHRILLAEAAGGDRGELTAFLEDRGHSVRVVDSDPAALEVAPVFKPSVIFLDLQSPELNGWELCQQLRDKDTLEAAAIFALMAAAPPEYADRCRHTPFDAYLLKPVDLTLADRLVACCPTTPG